MASGARIPEAQHLKRKALMLAAKPTKAFHAFAMALHEAHQADPAFLNEVSRIAGIKRRALFYLSVVGGFLAKYRISEAKAERIGWTKLQIVAHHVNDTANASKWSDRQIDKLLDLALQTTAHALPAVLRAQDTKNFRSMLLRLPLADYDDVEAALLDCGAVRQARGLANKEDAVAQLARAYLKLKAQKAL
ncbi:hypothetical protein [Stakelama pacifica]|uniref:Uncharacterized protein n=1 Tax=Stakelama pacifica TaxID=517720 RepID=A0A4R6FB16_9SPHN|nr:hypothetical protein [Stakelama pacifica]TDN77740.1 hypothetical protein EV664_1263 [Stakelama pacifica]GGP00863.1 hypothetical protein GCM10011329_37720 [Stakelama pacifica]